MPFRVESGRDANSAVHNAIGKMMRVDELAYHMITTRSNLATNLLLGVIGPDAVNQTLKELHVDDGIELRRGVEDELAFEKGINNMVTADGLLRILRDAGGGKGVLARRCRARMMDILHGQEFNQGIPARLPKGSARRAQDGRDLDRRARCRRGLPAEDESRTSTVILTEWAPDGTGRSRTIAAISHAIYEFLTQGPVDE